MVTGRCALACLLLLSGIKTPLGSRIKHDMKAEVAEVEEEVAAEDLKSFEEAELDAEEGMDEDHEDELDNDMLAAAAEEDEESVEYPNPSSRSCPNTKITGTTCMEVGTGSPYKDDMSNCPSKKIRKVKKSWVCHETNARPRCGWDPERKNPDSISRNEILDRAVVWVNHGIRYSQRRYHKERSEGNTEMAYRTDCSGFVSMAWKAEVALSTSHFAGKTNSKLFHRIACNELLPGDALVTKGKGHIVLFRKWKDQQAGKFEVWHEAGTSKGTVAGNKYFNKDMTKSYGPNEAHAIKYSSKPYLCIRRNNIDGDTGGSWRMVPAGDEEHIGKPCNGVRGTCIDVNSPIRCDKQLRSNLCPGGDNIMCCPE